MSNEKSDMVVGEGEKSSLKKPIPKGPPLSRKGPQVGGVPRHRPIPPLPPAASPDKHTRPTIPRLSDDAVKVLQDEVSMRTARVNAPTLSFDGLESLESSYPLESGGLNAVLSPAREHAHSDFEVEKTEISEAPFFSQRLSTYDASNVKAQLEGLSAICMGEVYPLSPRSYAMGRSASNDIVLSDRSLSRRHAELVVNVDGRAIVRDLGSSNGTYLNGHRINKADLRDGDQLKLGEAILRFTQMNPLANPPARRVINENNMPIVIDEPKAPQERPTLDPLRVVVTSAIIASLLVALMVTIFMIRLNNESDDQRIKDQATSLYLEGVSAMRNRDWDRAEAQFKHAQTLDPSVPGLNEQFTRIQVERTNAETLDNALRLYNDGYREEAQLEAEKIPRDSIYYNEAHKLLLSLE